MRAIGFANTFYTLWDVRAEDTYETINGQHRCNGKKIIYTYYQNLSIDEGKAKERFTELTGKEAPEPDKELRGKTASFHAFVSIDPCLEDEYPKGKYRGCKIMEVDDMDYLKWAYDNILNDERREIAKEAFFAHGYVESIYNDGFCTPAELEVQLFQKDRNDFKASLIGGLHFEDGEKVDLDLTVLYLGGFSGTYGWTNIYVFYTNDKKIVKYKGSKGLGIEEGDKISVKATVKHNRYYSNRVDEWIEETNLLRIKLI